ncbi:MAG: type II toxin-antitoxin system RelE family toxin [Chitinophagaceae bacterium]
MYRITFKRSAQKELADISKPYNQNIVTAIDKLAEDPRPDGVKKLKGENNAYRIRVSNYRVIYTIEEVIKIVEIQRIRHRKDVFK